MAKEVKETVATEEGNKSQCGSCEPNTTNKELGEIFANLVRGKEIICYRQVYARSISTRTGRPFEVPAALIGFEFA